ncbi:hypothetical protein UPYG_G00068000 [Umbra pygmaea]|uniref:Uncharacterized protein n=1 Tax=Umbra pygmaea TaxID=75934 RepID=A0ABD0XYB0_UMBPY
MTKIETINEIGHLDSSGFGRPWPRHGLQLLYWFSCEFVVFDNNGNLLVRYKPETKAFGFHPFTNRLECGSICYRLLPKENLPYYEVGNLNYPGASQLPKYVRKNYKKHHAQSNMDRIIISVHENCVLEKVYVTQHEDMRTFDRQNTYRISRGLVKQICQLELQVLLSQAGYMPASNMMVCRDVDYNCSPAPLTMITEKKSTTSEDYVIDMSDGSDEPQSNAFLHISDRKFKQKPRRTCCVIL